VGTAWSPGKANRSTDTSGAVSVATGVRTNGLNETVSVWRQRSHAAYGKERHDDLSNNH
jgi:hypothetical protein